MKENKYTSAREDFAAWVHALCLGKFDIWSKRGIHVVWSGRAMRSYPRSWGSLANCEIEDRSSRGTFYQFRTEMRRPRVRQGELARGWG
jgi:hypothetical protein